MALASSLALGAMLGLSPGAANADKGSPEGAAPDAPLANTALVSLADNEAQGNAGSGIEQVPSGVSADGRFVAFYSFATNLVTGDTNGHPDIFLRDRQAGTTVLVSHGYDGSPADALSTYPSISADGNYVAYVSSATNIVPNDTNGANDIFIYNRQTGVNSIVALPEHSFGTENPWISGDGHYVVFYTYAALVPADTNGSRDIYLVDLVGGGVELISANAQGTVGDGHSFTPYISYDGRYVAFESGSTNLVSGDTNNQVDIFVRDRVGGMVVRASVATGGAQGNNRSNNGGVSDNGRYVVFESLASNLVAGDTNSRLDIFVRDLQASTTTRVSVSSANNQGAGHSTEPRISGNGRYVVFQSDSLLAPSDPSILTDVYLRDLQYDTTEQISMSSSAQPGNSYSHKPQITADGSYVVFGSYAGNLVPNDTNDNRDTFLRDRTAACTLQFSDVPPGSTFHPYVMCLACSGIIAGYSDGTFQPNNQVTRGQLAKIVSNAAGYVENHTEQSFQDVPVGSTFYQFVQRLASRNIIGGYACGAPGEECVPPGNLPYFRPGNNVTRGQTSKIAAIAANLPAPPAGQQTFQDVAPGSTFWAWVEALASTGAIGGYACGAPGEECVPPTNRPYFRPGNNVTRGQSAKIIATTFFPDCQTR
jgi:Tol biopolymer transport system component